MAKVISIPAKRTDDQSITFAEAAAATLAHRTANPTGTRAWIITGGGLQNILNQRGCVGIRVYKSIDGAVGSLTICGLDALGGDMLQGLILGTISTCPPLCNNSVSSLDLNPQEA